MLDFPTGKPIVTQPGRTVPWRRVAVLIGVLAAVSCTLVDTAGQRASDPTSAPDSSRRTQQAVQSELMAFADRYFAATLDAALLLEEMLETPESRYVAAGARLVALITVTDIAASPNPGAALLDMTVFVTLRRMVWEDYWMPKVYGEDGQPVLDTLHELEADIWAIAAGVYTPDQLAELRTLINDWKTGHPDTRAVDFVRLTELGDARQVQRLLDASRPGGMLAPVREANRELEEMRLLAERLAFMATRMQLMLSLQVEMASAKLAVQPEVRQLLEDSRTFAEVSDRAALTFASLVADLPDERRAAIDQILAGLTKEREQVFDELGAEDGGVRLALGDLRETLETGRVMAESLDEAARDLDALAARLLAGSSNAPRPFDILEYQATFAELTATAREVRAVLSSMAEILGSGDIEGQIDPVIDGAKRLEDEVIDDIIDRVFLRGVALIVVFFVVLATYRLLIRRLASHQQGERG